MRNLIHPKMCKTSDRDRGSSDRDPTNNGDTTRRQPDPHSDCRANIDDLVTVFIRESDSLTACCVPGLAEGSGYPIRAEVSHTEQSGRI
jgi:hypothetical protein